MRLLRSLVVPFAIVVSMLAAGHARADVDLTGPWYLATNMPPPYGPAGCEVDVTQTGAAMTATGFCLGSYEITLAGTIDPMSGAFTATGSGGTGCAVVSIAGTAALDSSGFSGTFACDAQNGPFTGTKCGNEVVEPGEECDPGILANTALVNPCCSSSCTAAPAGFSCGTAAACRAPQCDGAGACGNHNFAAGTPCTDDGNVCTDDACDGVGQCGHVANTAPCSDGNFCTSGDHCAGGACVGACSGCCGGPGCTPAPATGCAGPTTTAGSLKMKLDTLLVDAQRVGWVWKKGDATDVADFGDPTVPTGYAFCVYRPHAPAGPVDLVLAADVPGGAYCAQPSGAFLPCWRPRDGKGFDFNNPNPAAAGSFDDGLRRMSLRAGATGKASIKVKAVGSHLRTQLYYGLDPVVAQLRASNGQCWEAGYVDALKDRIQFIGGTRTAVDYRANHASPSGAFLDPR
jgi:hypothetical protein